jgi:hypothetical protein
LARPPPGFHGNKRPLTKAEMQEMLKQAVENTPAVPEENEPDES